MVRSNSPFIAVAQRYGALDLTSAISLQGERLQGNKLETALKSRNWQAIAKTYNGPKYKKNKYDTELEAHYNAFKKETAK